ncbi:MAG: DUF2027 domain-containing protein [Muribaculaceae bacterium]|nr:DUF2027 domain-containing protein [Muribaculaceae bacterium]
MIKPGDTVRYLNAVGGGKVLRVEGKTAYVDDDGFETPFLVSDLVVVLPVGHVSQTPGQKMFDQQAYDTGRTSKRNKPEPQLPAEVTETAVSSILPEEEEFPIEETEYGDDMTVVLAFEPKNIKQLSNTQIAALLVNDSNYFLDFQLLRRVDAGWVVAASGQAAPNEVVELGAYSQQSVQTLERVVFQAIAHKKDKPFRVKMPLSASRKLDLTKFYKVHCFRPGAYFETPVIEIELLKEGRHNG